jgi:hypothetical protein
MSRFVAENSDCAVARVRVERDSAFYLSWHEMCGETAIGKTK